MTRTGYATLVLALALAIGGWTSTWAQGLTAE